MLRAAMIGAGGRAQAHYPLLDKLHDVSVEAVAELDAERMRRVVDKYGIPRAFTDYREMLDAVDPDVVYVVTLETQVTAIAVDCMNAGKHVFIEKPPGADSAETQTLLDAAEDNNVACMVGYQRRYAAVTPEAMRLVAERGPATLVVGEYHKNFLGRERPLTSTLWQDVTHIVDLVRFMAGSEVVEVTAYQDAFQSSWRNSYNGLIRFANDAVGIVTGNRASGGRYMRTELHGLGIGCYMRVPTEIEVLRDNEPSVITSGADLPGASPENTRSYSGEIAMHRDLIDSIRAGRTPSSDIRDVIKTARLIDQLEGVA